MNDNDEVSNSVAGSDLPDPPPLGWIKARISGILESWPVQIKITLGKNDYIVELADDAIIEAGKNSPANLEELAQYKEILILIEQDSKYLETYQAVYLKLVTDRNQANRP